LKTNKEMLTITITETQLRDLKVFLERCELRGAEAARFLSLVQAITQARPVEDKKEAETEEITVKI
jgi:hypothetical protein